MYRNHMFAISGVWLALGAMTVSGRKHYRTAMAQL